MGVYEKLIYKEDYLTERDWTVCRFRGGGAWQERGVGVFEKGGGGG